MSMKMKLKVTNHFGLVEIMFRVGPPHCDSECERVEPPHCDSECERVEPPHCDS